MNTKRGFFGGSKDDNDAKTPREATEEQLNRAKGDDPPPAEPAKQPDLGVNLNRETVDDAAFVNPHNEAFGQRPSEDANQKLREAEERFESPEVQKLYAWGQRTRLGGPRQGDWEEFDALVKERPTGKAKK